MKVRLKCSNCERYFVKVDSKPKGYATFRHYVRKCNWCNHTMDIRISDEDNFTIRDLGIVEKKKTEPKYKNPTTIITEEMKEMLKEFTKLAKPICKEYGVEASFKPSWNTRLQTTAGHYRYNSLRLELATNNYHEFGKEIIYATFLHELAHHICNLKYDKPNREKEIYNRVGHKEPFKIICHAIGGSMNCVLAGTKYKSSVDKAAYCKGNQRTKPHIYTCPTCDIENRFSKKQTYAYLESRVCIHCNKTLIDFKYYYDN